MVGYEHSVFFKAHWRKNQGGLFPLSPPLMLADFSANAAHELLKSQKSLFIRWESGFDLPYKTSWWHIIKDDTAALHDLSSNTRSKVRRGLKSFGCEKITRDIVLSEGYKVYRNAFARYDTLEEEIPEARFLDAVKSLPEQTEFWGVRDKSNGALVAFSENYVESEVCFYNTIWFEPSALRKYSSYALFYEMNRYYLEDRSFRYVSDGARSLSHDTQIHHFLESKFGFRKAYACLNVVYSPWLGAAVFVAFPFRRLIERVPFSPFKKASILLAQEEIRRQCAKVMG